MCCLRSEGTEPGREDPISDGAYSLINNQILPPPCTWKSVYLPNVYSACCLCQVLCWALGIQYTRQKKQSLPSMNRPTGREDRHATQSTANLRVTSKFIFKDCEKRGRTRAAQPRTEVGHIRSPVRGLGPPWGMAEKCSCCSHNS